MISMNLIYKGIEKEWKKRERELKLSTAATLQNIEKLKGVLFENYFAFMKIDVSNMGDNVDMRDAWMVVFRYLVEVPDLTPAYMAFVFPKNPAIMKRGQSKLLTTVLTPAGFADSYKVKAVFNAVATAMKKVILGNSCQQVTQKSMQVFDGFDVETDETHWSTLIAGGVTPVTMTGSKTQKIIRGVTTSLDSLEDLEMNVVCQDMYLRKTMKVEMNSFLGNIIDDDLLITIRDRIGDVLGTAAKDTIRSFGTPSVYESTFSPDEVIVEFVWTPRYALNLLTFRYGYDLKTGATRQV